MLMSVEIALRRHGMIWIQIKIFGSYGLLVILTATLGVNNFL